MCDTFVAMPSVTGDGSLIFGKNSDREPNEAQVLEFHPGRIHTLPADLKCTYLEIPRNQQWALTQSAFQRAWEKTSEWTQRVQSMPVQQSNKWSYSRYWYHQNREAGIFSFITG